MADAFERMAAMDMPATLDQVGREVTLTFHAGDGALAGDTVFRASFQGGPPKVRLRVRVLEGWAFCGWDDAQMALDQSVHDLGPVMTFVMACAHAVLRGGVASRCCVCGQDTSSSDPSSAAAPKWPQHACGKRLCRYVFSQSPHYVEALPVLADRQGARIADLLLGLACRAEGPVGGAPAHAGPRT